MIVEAQHMCSMMLGVKKVGATLLTQSMLGIFKEDTRARQEFLSLLRSKCGHGLPDNPPFSNEEL